MHTTSFAILAIATVSSAIELQRTGLMKEWSNYDVDPKDDFITADEIRNKIRVS